MLSKYIEQKVFDRSFVEGFLAAKGEGDNMSDTDAYPGVPSLMHQEVINYWDGKDCDVMFE